MTLPHILIIVVTLGLGVEAGAFLPSFGLPWADYLIPLASCLAASFAIWPIFRTLGLLPPLPGCPNGHGMIWAAIGDKDVSLKWKCRNCGLIVAHNGLSLDVLNAAGEWQYRLVKSHPYWLNGWHQPKHSTQTNGSP